MSDMIPASQAGVSNGLERARQPRVGGLSRRLGKQIQKLQVETGLAAFGAEMRHGLDRQKLQHEEERGRTRIGGAAEIALEAQYRNRQLSIEEALTCQTVFDNGRSASINSEYVRSVAGVLMDYRDRTA